MEITVIANSPIITKIALRGSILADAEADFIYLSNSLEKPIPVCFTNTPGFDDDEPFALSFQGEKLGSLELSPKTLVKLKAQNGEIAIDKLVEGSVKAIPAVPCTVLNITTEWSFDTDIKLFPKKQKGVKRDFIKEMKVVYDAELARIESLLK